MRNFNTIMFGGIGGFYRCLSSVQTIKNIIIWQCDLKLIKMGNNNELHNS